MSPSAFDFDNCPDMTFENVQSIGDKFEWSLTFKLFDFLDRLLCSTCGVLLVIGRSRSSLMLVLLITQASQAVLDFSSRAESCDLRAERTPLCAAMAERFSPSYWGNYSWDDDDGAHDVGEDWLPNAEWNYSHNRDYYEHEVRKETNDDRTSTDRDRDTTRPWARRTDY